MKVLPMDHYANLPAPQTLNLMAGVSGPGPAVSAPAQAWDGPSANERPLGSPNSGTRRRRSQTSSCSIALISSSPSSRSELESRRYALWNSMNTDSSIKSATGSLLDKQRQLSQPRVSLYHDAEINH